MSSTQRRLVMLIAFIVLVVIAAMVGIRAANGQTPRPAPKPIAPPTTRYSTTAPRPAPDAKRVLIISIDGLRPDVLLRADAPAIRAQMKAGSFTMWARTVHSANTLPSHTSMVTGVSPKRHGIEFNESQSQSASPTYPRVPTLLQIAGEAGLTTAIISGKSKFNTLARPGTVDYSVITDRAHDPMHDAWVADRAVEVITRFNPSVTFVHLPSVDTVGHSAGWGTAQQLTAVHNADMCVQRVLDAHRAAAPQAPTLIIITSDHGGAALSHRPDDPRALHIPWIVTGPHVKPDFDLTADYDLIVRTEDTFATACSFMGIKPKDPVEGKPIQQAFTVRMPAIQATQPATQSKSKPMAYSQVKEACDDLCTSGAETIDVTR